MESSCGERRESGSGVCRCSMYTVGRHHTTLTVPTVLITVLGNRGQNVIYGNVSCIPRGSRGHRTCWKIGVISQVLSLECFATPIPPMSSESPAPIANPPYTP